MTMSMTATADGSIQSRMQEVEELVREVEETFDPRSRQRAQRLVAAVLELHKAALGRVVSLLAADEHGDRALKSLESDELVAHLLLLHDLHPTGFAVRVARAVESAAVAAKRQGASLALESVDETTRHVVVRITPGTGCGSTAASLRQRVEEALLAAAPDAGQVTFDTASSPPVSTFVPVARLRTRPAPAGAGQLEANDVECRTPELA
jgi:Fe-S cluster biogenesis protein NfuA